MVSAGRALSPELCASQDSHWRDSQLFRPQGNTSAQRLTLFSKQKATISGCHEGLWAVPTLILARPLLQRAGEIELQKVEVKEKTN